MSCLSLPAIAAEQVVIADKGKAQLPIIVGAQADELTVTAAKDLADYLGRISGATFTVEQGSGASGLVIGTPSDFSALPIDPKFDNHPFSRDRFRIVSKKNGLYLIGATPQAAEFAAWDLLHRFGYRMFFPTQTWEVIPKADRLAIDIDADEKPSYIDRSGPRGSMRLSSRTWAVDGWKKWRIRNKTAQTFELNTGHVYGALIRANQEAFDMHPEYLAKINGVRKTERNHKFCIGNEGLRKLITDYVLDRVEKYPDVDSVSLDPSDGSGWCDETCELCTPLGSVSDRVVLLSNQVAEALEKKFDRTYYVGIYAYNDYSIPPSIKVHPKVIVSLATAFIRGDQTWDEMLAGWSAKTELIGIREYYGVAAWNSSLPGNARAGRIDYITRTIPEFYSKGARFMNAEADGAWGPNGLGYYLATRLLWDVTDGEQVDAIVEDFLEKSFGSAKQPMGEFYHLIAGSTKPHLSEHLVGRMYQLLKKARSMTNEPAELARIDDLVLYTRHVELNRIYHAARGDDRMPTLGDALTHAWRIRETQMADTLGYLSYLNRTVRVKDNGLEWGEGYTAVRPPTSMRVDEDKPFSEAEILSLIENGIKNNKTLSFEPVSYSNKLVPAPVTGGTARPVGRQTTSRGRALYYTWLTGSNPVVRLKAATGTVYTNRGNAEIFLQEWDEDEYDFVDVEMKEIPPDRKSHDVVLRAKSAGLHRVVVSERMSGTTVTWPDDLPQVTLSSMDHANFNVGRDDWYFYVPKGTKVVGAYVSARGGYILDPTGEKAFVFEDKSYKDYVTIDVPKGQDGKLWSVRDLAGSIRLLTVPPYGVGDPAKLMLPEDVMKADR